MPNRIDQRADVRAASSYINQADNAVKYDADDVKTIKARIKRAAKQHGFEIVEDHWPRSCRRLISVARIVP